MMEPIQKKVMGVSLEFVLQMAAMIVAVTMAYVAIDFRSKQTELDILDAKQERAKLEMRIRDVEVQQIRMDERFTNIMTLLTQINERLERAEGRE